MKPSPRDVAERQAELREYFAGIRARFEDRLPQIRAVLVLNEYQDPDAVIAAQRLEIDAAERKALDEVRDGRWK